MVVKVEKAIGHFEYAMCIQVRTLVFTVGQNVPPEREVDEFEDRATHFVASENAAAIGAGRWRPYKDGKAKIERVAVLESGRGKGVGSALMQAIIDDIKGSGSYNAAILGSQDHAIPFYEALGFKIYGDGYIDGGTIPHHDMILEFEGNAK